MSKEGAIERWRHLSGVDLPELEGCDVMLLIGSDMAHLLIHFEVRQGRWDETHRHQDSSWMDPVWKSKQRTL